MPFPAPYLRFLRLMGQAGERKAAVGKTKPLSILAKHSEGSFDDLPLVLRHGLPAGLLNAGHQDQVFNLSHEASLLAGNPQSKCGICVRGLLGIFDSITISVRT